MTVDRTSTNYVKCLEGAGARKSCIGLILICIPKEIALSRILLKKQLFYRFHENIQYRV